MKVLISCGIVASFFVWSMLTANVTYAYGNSNNSCITCHSDLKKNGNKLVNFMVHNWKDSIHRKNGVNCQACHGGNPLKSTKKGAHIGVFRPSNPKSTIYYKNIPATCGKCHRAELRAFKLSYHYKHLETVGNGPNCVTCHGSMSTHILTPETIAATCKHCHNYRLAIDPTVPGRAKSALLLISQSRLLLNAYKTVYRKGKTTAKTAWELNNARSNLDKAISSWHKFNLENVVRLIENMYYNLKAIK